MCKSCVGAKLVIRFQAFIAPAFLNRSMPFLYHKLACISGSICQNFHLNQDFVRRGHIV